jgi:hypothetical protein
MTLGRYKQFYEVTEELITKGKRFDTESLKLISFKDLNLAGVGNAGKAACRFELIEDEIKRRIDTIINMSFEEVESDKGKWEVIDDGSMYHAYYREKASPMHIKDAPKWKLLVEAMKNLRGDWSGGRCSEHLSWIYALLPLAEVEGVVPIGWCKAVKMNADTFDGHFNDGRIMRDGAMRLPEDVAKTFGFPSGDASGNIAKLMGAEPVRREGGYRGSYEELFEDILTPEQKVIYMSELIEKIYETIDNI